MNNLTVDNLSIRNPDDDILNFLNKSKQFEVFTTIEAANGMIKLIPEYVFRDPNSKFLDPAVKSGILLREIIYKLMEMLPFVIYKDPETGIEYDLRTRKGRTHHILRNMIYGIAISEMTAYISRRTVYGVMEANVDMSTEYLESRLIAQKNDVDENDFNFNDYYDHTMFNTDDRVGFEAEGNIFYPIAEETSEVEDSYYPFIVDTEHKFINKIKNGDIKFNVIISNPPSQVSDGGSGKTSTPVYNKFIDSAIKLDCRNLIFVTPSRWYSGGKGLDGFRRLISKSNFVRKIIDYENSEECFGGMGLRGVCYIYIDKEYSGKCEFVNIVNGFEDSLIRSLSDYNDVIIGSNKSIGIINKVLEGSDSMLSDIVSGSMPFGLKSNFDNYSDVETDYRVYARKRTEFIDYSNISRIHKSLNLYKIFLPGASGSDFEKPASILGRPILGLPNDLCTETYVVAGYFDSILEATNYSNYIKTKFFRFLVGNLKASHTISKRCFSLVPILDMDISWTDDLLYARYGLTENEIDYINKSIKNME